MPLTEIAVTAAGLQLIVVLARCVFRDRPAPDLTIDRPEGADVEDRGLVRTRS